MKFTMTKSNYFIVVHLPKGTWERMKKNISSKEFKLMSTDFSLHIAPLPLSLSLLFFFWFLSFKIERKVRRKKGSNVDCCSMLIHSLDRIVTETKMTTTNFAYEINTRFSLVKIVVTNKKCPAIVSNLK